MIIPALDILNHKIVRLYKGNYNSVLHYSYKLTDIIKWYNLKEIKRIHIVDLQGARDPSSKQVDFIQKLLKNFTIPLQVGGGIRTEQDIEQIFLNNTNSRVVIGSLAIQNMVKVKNWFKKYTGNRIVLALDIKIDHNKKKCICINGWKTETQCSLERIINEYSELGLQHVLCTDVTKDGTLSGPNIQLYSDIIQQFPHLSVQASGGISSLSDIINIKKTNINSIIIGRAFLEKKFTIKEAISCWQKESFPV
ncbi:1-(5-phosphoribosyl)-5-[(5-phosphoribosylamino)methylideneamino] imidazole-4-carboxamide isomerase [Buchnera aphidicola (Thelaxes suberi)]|uniref:1-(5-phosphoribosyl)-5-[(5- phosphoribosylamino)methylideneamino]imidazole-4- carboxamide isomerase n=1 Tax=Buchnera aphidicola TaxID=9 RepID=UPI003463A2D4